MDEKIIIIDTFSTLGETRTDEKDDLKKIIDDLKMLAISKNVAIVTASDFLSRASFQQDCAERKSVK